MHPHFFIRKMALPASDVKLKILRSAIYRLQFHSKHLSWSSSFFTVHRAPSMAAGIFFPEDCNILDFLSTLFQLIFSQLRKTPTVPLQLLHTASLRYRSENKPKKWRFSRPSICMAFLLCETIFTKFTVFLDIISQNSMHISQKTP